MWYSRSLPVTYLAWKSHLSVPSAFVDHHSIFHVYKFKNQMPTINGIMQYLSFDDYFIFTYIMLLVDNIVAYGKVSFFW